MGASRPLKQTKSQTAASIWAQLASAQEPFPGARCIRDLPEPARRWLRHSVRTGRAIATSAQVEMDGDIRLGRWLRFRASQVVSPPRGFLWAAKARMGPFSITGYDRYADEIGEMRWRLGGLVPVMNAEGPDLTRSAAGRLAVDAFFVPTAFLGPSVTWKESTAPTKLTSAGPSGASRSR